MDQAQTETVMAPSSPIVLTSDEDDDENTVSTPSSPTALTSDEDDNENAPSTPSPLTALTSDEDEDKNEKDEQDHKDVNDDECEINESTDIEDDRDESDSQHQEQERVHIHVQHGLPPDMHTSNSMFANLSTFELPCFLKPMINCIATGRIIFGGSSSLIDSNDLKSLHGHGKTSEDKWVSNFVVDRYLELLKLASVNVPMEVVAWEIFEKGVGAVPAKEVLKGISNILNQDLLLVPCNIDSSHHWFLLVVQPPLKHVMVFESMPGRFIKPLRKLLHY